MLLPFPAWLLLVAEFCALQQLCPLSLLPCHSNRAHVYHNFPALTDTLPSCQRVVLVRKCKCGMFKVTLIYTNEISGVCSFLDYTPLNSVTSFWETCFALKLMLWAYEIVPQN